MTTTQKHNTPSNKTADRLTSSLHPSPVMLYIYYIYYENRTQSTLKTLQRK